MKTSNAFTRQAKPLTTRPDDRQNASEIEEKFLDMLDYLSSPPYFVTIWEELRWLTELLGTLLDRSDLNSDNFPEYEIEDRFDKEGNNDDGLSNEGGKKKLLHDVVVRVVRQITQTASGTRALLTALGDNLGHFIHFVLRCLHRRNEIQPTAELSAVSMITKPTAKQLETGLFPFFEDRCEFPQAEGVTRQALRRLEFLLHRVVDNQLLEQLKPEKSEIPEYNPRTDHQIRVDFDNLQSEHTALKKEFDESKAEHNNKLEEFKCDYEAQLKLLEETSEKKYHLLDEMHKKLREEYFQLENQSKMQQEQIKRLDQATDKALDAAKVLDPDWPPKTIAKALISLWDKRRTGSQAAAIKQALEDAYKLSSPSDENKNVTDQ